MKYIYTYKPNKHIQIKYLQISIKYLHKYKSNIYTYTSSNQIYIYIYTSNISTYIYIQTKYLYKRKYLYIQTNFIYTNQISKSHISKLNNHMSKSDIYISKSNNYISTSNIYINHLHTLKQIPTTNQSIHSPHPLQIQTIPQNIKTQSPCLKPTSKIKTISPYLKAENTKSLT